MFWQRWLLVVGVGLAAFGVVMAAINGTAPFDVLFNRQIDPAFFGDAAPPEAARAFRGWVYGAWGGTVAGWGILIAFIAAGPFRAGKRWAWWCIALATGTWFVIDSAASIAFGVYFNAFAVNLPVLVLIALPLALDRRRFLTARAGGADWD